MTVFADTSALLPVVDRDATDHVPAIEQWRRWLVDGAVLLTTNYDIL